MATTIEDLIRSSKANELKIKNTPTPEQLKILNWLCGVVDNTKRVLASGGWYNPTLTSGFRTDKVAIAVGGHAGDEHTMPSMKRAAFDLDCHLGDAQSHLVPARWIFNRRLELGAIAHQIIAEPGHVHVGVYCVGYDGPTELRIKEGAHYPLLALSPKGS